MSFITKHKQKFEDLRFYLDANNKNQIRLKGNGGNSILFTYPPNEEEKYLEEALNRLGEQAAFVEVSHLLVRYIDEMGWSDFASYYQDFSSTPGIVFKSENDDVDLFDQILASLKAIDDTGRIPVLIRTGCLYGTGIENVMIMEHPTVMAFKNPLVIFYPAIIDSQKNLQFLGFKSASKYRCVLID